MHRRWREIRRCRDAAQADAIAAMLTAAGIQAIVPPPHAMGRQPTCQPAGDDVRVLVPDDDFAAAQAWLTWQEHT